MAKALSRITQRIGDRADRPWLDNWPNSKTVPLAPENVPDEGRTFEARLPSAIDATLKQRWLEGDRQYDWNEVQSYHRFGKATEIIQ
ncbi:MAG: hypothetical protein K5799_04980 [Erythrobacter sp.]|nr:hypothetical protein [Erythrobacter sp.]